MPDTVYSPPCWTDLATIEAPQEPREGPEKAPEASEGAASPRSDTVGAQEGAEEPERRSWWIRIFGG